MDPDFDDTRLSAPQTPVAVAPEVDLEDTVARVAGAEPGDRSVLDDDTIAPANRPPALVEPPAPEARPLPTFFEPVDTGEIEIPVVAALRAVLPDGTQLVLDAPVYVGRKPSIPRIHTGPTPHLVTLPSPTREMSATHLELKVIGGALVASDMRSTNGTVVQLPGSAPRTLIRGESAVIVPGTRIDLGEGAVIDILPPLEAVDA